MDTTLVVRYRALHGRLRAVRDAHGGEESHEEDLLLGEMDSVWWQLAPSERRLIDEIVHPFRRRRDRNPFGILAVFGVLIGVSGASFAAGSLLVGLARLLDVLGRLLTAGGRWVKTCAP